MKIDEAKANEVEKRLNVRLNHKAFHLFTHSYRYKKLTIFPTK